MQKSLHFFASLFIAIAYGGYAILLTVLLFSLCVAGRLTTFTLFTCGSFSNPSATKNAITKIINSIHISSLCFFVPFYVFIITSKVSHKKDSNYFSHKKIPRRAFFTALLKA